MDLTCAQGHCHVGSGLRWATFWPSVVVLGVPTDRIHVLFALLLTVTVNSLK